MIRLGTGLALGLLLAACDAPVPSGSAVEATKSAIAYDSAARAVLVKAGLDIIPVIAASGSGWIGNPVLPDLPDSYNETLGLYRSTSMFKNGSIVTDRVDDGSLYLVLTRSGLGDRCGSSESLFATADAILAAVDRDALTGEEKVRAEGVLQSDGKLVEFERRGALIRFIGGCTKALLIKAV